MEPTIGLVVSDNTVKLHESMIVEQSHIVLDHLGHEVVGLQLAVERKLQSIGDPEISWHVETVETGFLRALAGKRRDFLVIQHARLREYSVLIAVRPHGTALHAAWMVVATPRFTNDLQRAVRLDAEPGTRLEVGAELDLFDILDLKAFVSLTRLALKHAIRELTDEDAVLEPEGVE